MDYSNEVPYVIDFDFLRPYVIDAFTEVYGDEYHEIISERENKAIILPYYDVNGLESYIDFIKRCKRREYSIRFLDEIGVNVEKYKKENYTKELDEEVNKLLENLIDSAHFGFCDSVEFWVPLKAFEPNNPSNPNVLLTNKVKIINYLLGENHEVITVDNLDSFTKTAEYQKILKIIEKYKIVHEKLLLEYREWEKIFLPYENYIKYERKRKKDILDKYKTELYIDIYRKLPTSLKYIIHNKEFKEQVDSALGTESISSPLPIESFSSEQINKLKSSDTKLFDKSMIILEQSFYLKGLGISIPDEIVKCKSEEDIEKYLLFLNQDNIKEYLPSDELISNIALIREKKYEEATKEYYTTRIDFKNAIKGFEDKEENRNYIYQQIKENKICIAGGGGYSDSHEFVSIMFFTIRVFDYGRLFSKFVHESGHVIDQSIKSGGFELSSDFCDDGPKNPYDSNYRKYEKFNETINDMFMIEVINILQKKGIYLIEPFKYTISEISNENTALVTKDLLRPLLEKFRNQIINVKLTADRDEFTKYIGVENFEELVDVVNKVDYLSRNGLIPKIDSEPNNPMVLEYNEQVKRVQKIYENINEYYNKHFAKKLYKTL